MARCEPCWGTGRIHYPAPADYMDPYPCSACRGTGTAPDDTAEAVLRDALKGYGPWAHTMGCGTNVGKDCDCWIGRARRLLGMEER